MGKHKGKSKKHKRDKTKKHRNRRSRSSSKSESSAEEWVEKKSQTSDEEPTSLKSVKNESKRDDWMSLSTSFTTTSNDDRRKLREENKRLEREQAKYNPRESTRELNPYWKEGGDGLPTFKRPADDGNYEKSSRSYGTTFSSRPKPTLGWRKKAPETISKPGETSPTETNDSSEILSVKELNILASKLIKAEIMGKTELVEELRQKLEAARNASQSNPEAHTDEVILTQTDSQGHSRPLKHVSDKGQYSRNDKKKRKVETHNEGQRVRYFADDGKQSLQQMFENEKYNTVEDQNSQFMKMASQIRKNEDMDEIFTDNIRKEECGSKVDARSRDRAINEHRKINQSLDSCKLCLQSKRMNKHLMVTLGETAFLAVPPQEPLTQNHCCIVSIRHVTCSLLLDENEWDEIMDLRKSLTRMFQARNEDVIFFETAKNLDKYPHMFIECVPLDREEGDMAPIYFKKAIDECEAEWAQNKKLVSLKGKDVRKAIPKGLSYFFVSFGMEEGYAHVIEDQKDFPGNFAHEIIGGMLDLHHSKWRKPKYQSFDEQTKRTLAFSKQWDDFNTT